MSDSISVNTHSETSIGTTVETSTGDQTSTIEVNATIAVGTQMPDDSEDISASVGAIGDAFGEDTFTSTSVSGVASDDGVVASIDIDAEALAVGQSLSGDGAFGIAITDASISDGVELSFVGSVTSEHSVSNADESVSVAYSETSVVALDLDLSDIGGGGGGGTDSGGAIATPTIEPDAVDAPAAASDDAELGLVPTADVELMDIIDIDGNIAIIEADVTVNSVDSAVQVDAFALTIEDELSTSMISVDIALSV